MANVLVVDDLNADLDALRIAAESVLESEGGQVETARSVEDAFKLIREHRFDVVVTDLQLTPDKRSEGLDVLRYARRANAQTQVIVVTNFPEPWNQAESMALGAFDYIDKAEGDLIENMGSAIGRALAAEVRL